MPRKLNKRRVRIQLTLLYSAMVIAVIAIVSILILMIQGYRYNSDDGRVEQGGLVQYDSQPSGATVTVDGIKMAGRTASKSVLSAGGHNINISREGYTNWQKDVIVKPGTILWLNYARLFPLNPVTSVATDYANVSSAMFAPNQQTIAVITHQDSPNIMLTTLNTDSPVTSEVSIPATAYTAPNDVKAQKFQIISWDKDSRLLLIRHDYNDTSEYLSVDTRDTTKTVNLSMALGINILSASYALNDSNILYILSTNHELRRINIGDMTISGPLVEGIDSFVVSESNLIVYTTMVDPNGLRTVGYITNDSVKGKIISSYSDLSNETTLKINSGTYYGNHYVTILHDNVLSILRGGLPSSNSNSALILKNVATLTIKDGGDYLGFSPGNDRIIYVARGNSIVTYDLELRTTATISLQAPLTSDVQWLDRYHIASTSSENGYYYDYDGANGQMFASKVMKLPAMPDSSGKYIYYFTATDTGVSLSRVKTTIN